MYLWRIQLMKEYKIKFEEPPAGYEAEAVIRVPKAGETILNAINKVDEAVSEVGLGVATYPVLTKKKSWAESNGFEVGAVYHICCPKEGDDWNPYLITPDGPLELLVTGSPSSLSIYSERFIKNHHHRKVINADGSMVDGDIEWVRVGGHEVTKADLRAASYEWVCPF